MLPVSEDLTDETETNGYGRSVLFTFSNGAELSDERVFLQANNIPHLVKPFEVAELIAQARRLLQKAQAAAAGAD